MKPRLPDHPGVPRHPPPATRRDPHPHRYRGNRRPVPSRREPPPSPQQPRPAHRRPRNHRRHAMTTPDSTALVAAAQQRSHDTRRRAVDALRRLVNGRRNHHFHRSRPNRRGVTILALPPTRPPPRDRPTPHHPPDHHAGGPHRPAGVCRLPPQAPRKHPRRDPAPHNREPSPPRTSRPALRPTTRRRSLRAHVGDMSTTYDRCYSRPC